MINTKTDLYGIIGDPVSHSKSPLIHNAAFKHQNKNSVYLAFNIVNENLNAIIPSFKLLKELKGLNITVPHKVNIIKFTDKLDCTAEEIGSVNTIKNENGIWTGYNTDWYGVFKTLENNLIDNKSKVLIIGSGGAAPAVIYGLRKYGIADITITNRTEENSDKLAETFKIDKILFSEYKNHLDDFSLIINTTTLPFNNLFDVFNSNTVYYDLKYYTDFSPVDCKYIDGKDMLLYQAAMAYKIWTDTIPPIDVMKESMDY